MINCNDTCTNMISKNQKLQKKVLKERDVKTLNFM